MSDESRVLGADLSLRRDAILPLAERVREVGEVPGWAAGCPPSGLARSSRHVGTIGLSSERLTARILVAIG